MSPDWVSEKKNSDVLVHLKFSVHLLVLLILQYTFNPLQASQSFVSKPGNSAAAKMGKATGLVAAKCSRFRCGFDDVVVSKTADTRADAVQIVTFFISVCFFACLLSSSCTSFEDLSSAVGG